LPATAFFRALLSFSISQIDCIYVGEDLRLNNVLPLRTKNRWVKLRRTKQGRHLANSGVCVCASSFRCNIWCHSQHLCRRSIRERNKPRERGFEFHFGALNQKMFETLGVVCQRHLMHPAALPQITRRRECRHLRLLLSWSVIVSYGHAASCRQY